MRAPRCLAALLPAALLPALSVAPHQALLGWFPTPWPTAPCLPAAHIPPLSVDERRRAFEAATQHALSRGITMVHDLGRCAPFLAPPWRKALHMQQQQRRT